MEDRSCGKHDFSVNTGEQQPHNRRGRSMDAINAGKCGHSIIPETQYSICSLVNLNRQCNQREGSPDGLHQSISHCQERPSCRRPQKSCYSGAFQISIRREARVRRRFRCVPHRVFTYRPASSSLTVMLRISKAKQAFSSPQRLFLTNFRFQRHVPVTK